MPHKAAPRGTTYCRSVKAELSASDVIERLLQLFQGQVRALARVWPLQHLHTHTSAHSVSVCATP
jgi:hypothetical protein